MDIEKLIERLKAKDFERDYDCTPFECGVFGLLDDAATALSTLQAENEKLRAELNVYKSLLKQLVSLPDCNTCDSKGCVYRPNIGAFTRINCPLWRGQKED